MTSDVILEIVKFVFGVLGPVLAILLTLLVKKLVDKAGIERTTALDNLIEHHVSNAVEYAERYANKLSTDKMDGKSKAALAVATVLGELEKAGVKDVASDLIARRIEAYLEKKEPTNLAK